MDRQVATMTELRVLVEAAQAGDRTAFGEIVTRFQDMAFAGAYALLGDVQAAQDAAQEAFWEAYRNLAKLREPAAFPGWFQRIVVGRAYRELRRQLVTLLPLESIAEIAIGQPDPAEQFLAQQQQQEITQALATLPEAQRLAVTLCYIEGYSYQEIADFLEAPLSTVKKRLFDARRKLKGRMLHMVQEKLQGAKPSQDAEFAQKIGFFLALRDQDLDALQQFVGQNSALLTAQTEWPMALGHYHWPLGSTALHLAAATGTPAVLAYLLAQPVDRAAPNRSGLTPLHLAAIMGQAANVQLLLDHGVSSNAVSPSGQTPLHNAIQRNNLPIAEILLQNGAAVDCADKAGRTPVDWAVIRNNGAMLDLLVRYGAHRPPTFVPSPERVALATPPAAFDVTQLLGTIVTSADPLPPAFQTDTLGDSIYRQDGAPLLPTGIKIIDLLAPLVRGGQNGIFTPLSGVGMQVVIGQLIHSMKALHDGYTVWLFLESDRRRAAEQKLLWREAGVDEQIVYVPGKSADTPSAHRQTVAKGLAIAEAFQRAGHNVLLVVESRLAESEGVMAALRTQASVTPAAAITTLIYGNHTPGVLPAVYSGLDSVLAFDYTRAVHRLYPAIDPVRATSTLLQRGLLSPEHRETAAAVKRLLQRYGELRSPMEQYKMGSDALWYIEDDPNLYTDINCARRLDRFLTQPFHGAEPWSGQVGKLVPVAATIADCQAILTGQYNALPEEAFAYTGTLEEVVAKASRSA